MDNKFNMHAHIINECNTKIIRTVIIFDFKQNKKLFNFNKIILFTDELSIFYIRTL